MYRNKKLLQYARHCSCQYCGADLPEGYSTVVAAHSNHHDKGGALKASDCFIAYLCFDCHNIVDGRTLPNLDQQTRDRIWITAHQKTLAILINKNMLDPEAMNILHQAGSI
jgi:5-methylcytosine-specific restriction endonuclease McrA